MDSRVDLYWIPLGAGGVATVRISGRIYERAVACRERRDPLDLYHTALEVRLKGERFVIENAWPSPDDDIGSRGVVLTGPVWAPWLIRFRAFRYEVRCWKGGKVADIAEAVATGEVSTDPKTASRLIDLAATVPSLSWGRRIDHADEMWNSNSVISYLLASAGLPAAEFQPPIGGTAPGWRTGIAVYDAGRARASRESLPTS